MPPHQNTQPHLARDVMVTRVMTASPECEVAKAIQSLLKNRVSGMPVVDAEHRYQGMFSQKCCMKILNDMHDRLEKPEERLPSAADFMVPAARLFTLSPDDDVFDAIQALLKRRISGAPVTSPDGTFLGVFSEKTSMKVLIEAAYEGLPTTKVSAFIDADQGRIIQPETDLMTCARIFLDTPYRRLPVLKGNRLVGQITRSDVLRNSKMIEKLLRYKAPVAVPQQLKPGADSMIFLRAHDQLPSSNVAAFADKEARTITGDIDLLGIAQLFLNTPYRRFPVVEGESVIGQVSRRNLLSTAFRLIESQPASKSGSLVYLSALGLPGAVPWD